MTKAQATTQRPERNVAVPSLVGGSLRSAWRLDVTLLGYEGTPFADAPKQIRPVHTWEVSRP